MLSALTPAYWRDRGLEPAAWMLSALAGVVSVIVAVLVLVGWAFDVVTFESFLGRGTSMRPVTAVSLLMLGTALIASTNGFWSRQSRARRVAISRVCAGVALLISLVTALEYLGIAPFSIDQWLFWEAVRTTSAPHPGRIGPAPALVIGMLAVSLLTVDARAPAARTASTLLALFALLVPFISMLAFLYEADTLHDFPPYFVMAVHTAVAFTLLGFGVLFARPERAFVQELVSPHLGGLMARSILPFVLTVPIAIGWVRLEGQRAGLYETDLGVALFAVANMLIFSVLVWFAARQLNRADADRRTADFQAVQALRIAEARWRALVDASAQIVWTTDARGEPDEDSPSWRAFTGQTPAQIASAGPEEAIHPEDRVRMDAKWSRGIAMGRGFEGEYRLRHVSGEYRWTCMRAVPIRSADGAVASWVGMNTDITENKRAQALTEGQKQVLEMIARDAPLGETLNALVRLIEAQSADMLCSILLLEGKRLRHGAAPHLPAEYTAAIDGEQIGPAVGSCGTAAFTRRAVFVEDIATDPLWKDYKHLALPHGLRACWSTPILDGAGRVVATFAVYYRRPALPNAEHIRLIDLATQTASICLTRHHAVQALRDSERRFRHLAESIPQLVWTCDKEGSLDYVSRQWIDFTGVPASEQLGAGWLERLHPDDRERVVTTWHAAVTGGTEFHSEYRLRRHDGAYRWFDSRGASVLDDQGRIARWCGTNTDITDRKQVEESQLRSQKLEALGTLSGGIAHDFNNMLLVIAGNTRLAADLIEKGHAAQTPLSEVAQASARAADLVRRILAFSRPQATKHKQIRLQPVIRDAMQLVRSTLPAMIEVRCDLPETEIVIAADTTQVHQVLVNLATNAAHAIGSRGGHIDVSLMILQAESQAPAYGPDLPPGRYARIAVRDDGSGMSPEVMARIFDPFFTTKPAGQGTGLGLSIVHGIMQSCGGAVRVQSERGKGTTFHLYFPVIENGTANEPTGKFQALPGSGQHILLIDDEDSLVRLGTILLTRHGYRVTGCTDPFSAVKQFRRDPHQFHAVVTDLSMPGMSGFDCARELLEARPDIPIVLTSGYVRPEDETCAKEAGIRAIVTKPAALDQLPDILAKVFAAD